ncbi:MAG: helix-turn-helix domain-containing protein [Bradymonadia bacterium]
MASRDDDLTPDTNIGPLASVEYRFGKWLKQQRAERKLSQSDLASRLSITPSFLSRIESDARQPSNDLLANLSVVLGLPMQILQLKAGVIPAELMRSIQQNPERLLTLYAAQ